MVQAHPGTTLKTKALTNICKCFFIIPQLRFNYISHHHTPPFFSLSYRWRELVARAHLVPPNLFKTFYNPSLVTTFPLFRPNIPPLEVASDSWVCVKGEVCHLSQLVPLRGFGGLPNKRLVTIPPLREARGRFPPLFRHTPS